MLFARKSTPWARVLCVFDQLHIDRDTRSPDRFQWCHFNVYSFSRVVGMFLLNRRLDGSFYLSGNKRGGEREGRREIGQKI
jgi:hypothetical protein